MRSDLRSASRVSRLPAWPTWHCIALRFSTSIYSYWALTSQMHSQQLSSSPGGGGEAGSGSGKGWPHPARPAPALKGWVVQRGQQEEFDQGDSGTLGKG